MPSAPVWLFDLDNTLHNASTHVFPHINRSMTEYLEHHLALTREEANALRVHYWQRYGATLLGLVRHHGTDPHHFLRETHRFEKLSELMVFERALRGMLQRLPGRKIVFTNGPWRYGVAVLQAIGLQHCFTDVVGIEQMRFHPKPGVRAFRHLLHDHRLNPRRCVLVEDTAENLRTARRLGMRTVLVSRQPGRPAYVDVKIASILDLRRSAGRLLGA